MPANSPIRDPEYIRDLRTGKPFQIEHVDDGTLPLRQQIQRPPQVALQLGSLRLKKGRGDVRHDLARKLYGAATPPRFSRIETAIHQDPVEPGREFPLRIEAVYLLQRGEKALLYQIFGIFALTQQSE